MILSFDLSNDIQCDKLCKRLHKAIGLFIKSGNSLKDCQLVIDIRKVVDSNDSLLPKIEYKN